MIYKSATVCASLTLLSGCFLGGLFSRGEEQTDPSDKYVVYTDGVPRVRIGVGVIVQVSVPSMKPVEMQAQVDQKGEITLPYLLESPVACDGLTLEDLKGKLKKEYQKYIKQPQVTVTFAPYDGHGVSPWGFVTVLGEVGSPGPVNLPRTMDLTVTKALKEAGGLRPYANKSKIRLMRKRKRL